MHIVQRIFLYAVSALLIVAGAALVVYPISELYQVAIAQVPRNWLLRVAIGFSAAAVGVFTVLPFGWIGRRGKKIAFPGAHGTVVIQLGSFEASLRKTISKLPVVKKINVTVAPTDNDRKVGIHARVTLVKPIETGARETADRLREYIDKAARRILGADEVTTVDVEVVNIIVDSTQTAESLEAVFAEREAALAAAPVAAAAASTAIEDTEAVPVTQAAFAPEPEPETMKDESSELLTYDEAQRLHSDTEAEQGAEQEAEQEAQPALSAWDAESDGRSDSAEPEEMSFEEPAEELEEPEQPEAAPLPHEVEEEERDSRTL
ncbi:MAG: hypothetical protein AMXMBFR4_30660 [Candidatus Hydrogenedentota bacterium]